MRKFLTGIFLVLVTTAMVVVAYGHKHHNPTSLTGATQPIQTNLPIQAGKDYQPATPVPGTTPDLRIVKGKVQVIEFFSYGCPWCFRFEPFLEKWLATKPADVDFVRVPVVFQPGWDILARAYFVAEDLGVENKITPSLFTALQVQGQDLTNEAALREFFAAQGVSPQDFDSTFHFSPLIDAQMMRSDNLMRAYVVFEIPTFLIDGKYKTNPRMVGGDLQRLTKVLDFLIAQERNTMKTATNR